MLTKILLITAIMVTPAIADTTSAYNICMKHLSTSTHSGRPANGPMFESKFQAVCIPIMQAHDDNMALHNAEKNAADAKDLSAIKSAIGH